MIVSRCYPAATSAVNRRPISDRSRTGTGENHGAELCGAMNRKTWAAKQGRPGFRRPDPENIFKILFAGSHHAELTGPVAARRDDAFPEPLS